MRSPVQNREIKKLAGEMRLTHGTGSPWLNVCTICTTEGSTPCRPSALEPAVLGGRGANRPCAMEAVAVHLAVLFFHRGQVGLWDI